MDNFSRDPSIHVIVQIIFSEFTDSGLECLTPCRRDGLYEGQYWCHTLGPWRGQYWAQGRPSTGPVLAQHWAEYWSSTGPVLGIILAQYCPSTVENRGHGLVQCWRNSKACLAHQKPNHCHQKMSYGECLNVFHMPTHKPACQGASSKAPLGILKMVAL